MSRATQDTAGPCLRSRKGLSPAVAQLSRCFHSAFMCRFAVLQPPTGRNPTGLGWSPFARHYWGNHVCFLFLRVLRCFSSPRLPPYPNNTDDGLMATGLSHSETSGSKAVCALPELIAAYRVLHRLREPRHPPCALYCFFYLWLVPASPPGEAGAHTCSFLTSPRTCDGQPAHTADSFGIFRLIRKP